MKIAFTGTSGAGKTTLVRFVEQMYGLTHYSSSASDIMTEEDKQSIKHSGNGHLSVIKRSAEEHEFAYAFQTVLLKRRSDIIKYKDDFVTDRSPADNITYFMTQAGFHPELGDDIARLHIANALSIWNELTHVIYIKPVQPESVENNGSRIPNKYYQISVDAIFDYWINWLQANAIIKPKLLILDYWNLERRKNAIIDFLES